MISVFGGTGFIGNRFIEKYRDECRLIERACLTAQSDNILYFISTTHNYNVFDRPLLDIDTNLTHLIKVLEANKGKIKEFNFISSWFVYGDATLPAKETSFCNPKGFYSITKKCAEDLLTSYCKTFNINYRILRLSNVYGKTDTASHQKNALQFLINKIKINEDIDLYYDGYFLRDYLHVDDVCEAIKLVLDKQELNSIINIGSGVPQLFRRIIEFVLQETQSTSKIRSIDSPEFHKIVQVKDMCLDTSKLKDLGFKPKFDIFSGVKDLIHNY
jgi:nucleoside-diphosphate-sugar epimerase